MPADPDVATSRALPEIIDPQDTVCVPRYTCPKTRTSELDSNLPYTDSINNVRVSINYFGARKHQYRCARAQKL